MDARLQVQSLRRARPRYLSEVETQGSTPKQKIVVNEDESGTTQSMTLDLKLDKFLW